MPIDIAHLTYDQLLELNRQVIDRLKQLDQARIQNKMQQFRIGERVVFEPEGRNPVQGVIAKLNQKTATVVTDDGYRWRIPPQFLRRSDQSEAGHPGSGNVVSLKPPSPKRKK